MGMDVTHGPGTYQQSILNIDANVSKIVNFGLVYEQSSSTTSVTLIKSYTAMVGIKPNKHWGFGLSGSNSPEADSAKSAGWGVNGGYNSGEGDFTWEVSAAYNGTLSSEYIDYQSLKAQLRNGKVKYVAIDHSQWMNLKQSDVDPTVTFGLFHVVDLAVGYSKFSYDRDVSVFSQKIAKLTGAKVVRNGNFGGVTSLIDGFPDRIASAGIGVSPLNSFRVSFDWARTDYVLDQPREDSSTYSLEYTFWSALQVKAAYNILAYRDTYTTVGLKWIW
jgi:hypothetical protein